MESGWAELPEELLTKVLEALLSGVRLRTEAGVGARPRLVRSGWKCRHDALVMWLLLRQDATDEGALVRGGSLDLTCYCFNALTKVCEQ